LLPRISENGKVQLVRGSETISKAHGPGGKDNFQLDSGVVGNPAVTDSKGEEVKYFRV